MNEPAYTSSLPHVRCDVCGRQDETVRLVVYPYVFSFIVVTFQRAFSGCWCRLHRIQRWLAASLITSIFGWFGFPFGIIFTPVRLLQLARGGSQDGNINGQILRAIGDEKLKERDSAAAIRCFEASLLYADDSDTREKLRNLYRTQQVFDVSPASGLVAVLIFSAIPVLFAVLGMIIGLIDYSLGWISSSIFQEFPIYLFILIQAPMVIAIYFCVILLAYLLKTLIRSARISSSVLLSVSGIVFSFMFLYATIVGETFGIYIGYFINGFREPLKDVLTTLAAISTHAGFYIFSAESLSTNPTGNIFYAVLLLLSFAFSLSVLLPIVRENTRQQSRLQGIRQYTDQPGDGYSIGGWVGVLGFLVAVALFYFMTPQKSHVDTLEAYDHVNKGYFQLTSNQPVQAVLEYKKALELKPEFVLGHVLLGNVYLSMGETEKARESFETASKFDPDNPAVHNGFGWIYIQESNNESAEREFRESLQNDPQNLDAHLGLSWIYLYQLKVEESKKEFQAVLAVSLDIPDAHLGLGILFYVENDFDKALDSLDTALRLDPNLAEAYFYKGIIFTREDRYEDADEAFRAALKLQPEHYGALNGLGDIRAAHYEFKVGMEYYDKAIAKDPERVDAYLSKAYVLNQMGEFDKAISLLEPFAEEDGRIQPVLSYIYYLKESSADGDKFLQDSISFADSLNGIERGQGYIAIAAVEYSITDFTEAKRYGELATNVYPIGLDADTHFFMARIYSALGDFDRAQAALDSGSSIGHSEVSFHIAKARLLIDQEKLDEAQRELQSVLQIDNKSASANGLMSFIHYQQGDMVRALVDAKKAVQLNPYDSYAHSRIAFAYQSMGRTDEALVEAQEAVRLNTLEDTSHYILGVCYMEKGMNADAIAEFEKFLDRYWDRAYVRDYKLKAEEYLAQLKAVP